MTQPTRPADNAISVRQLVVELGGVRVLDGITLDIAARSWVTVIGPNGAGKSTLLRAVAGLTPGSGTVEVAGVPIQRMRRRQRARQVALVPQDPQLPPGMAVFDYVLLGRTPYIPALGRESAADLDTVRQVLRRLDLTQFVDRPLVTLSGGERQRVFLARALAQEAPLLLLDEPTSALDIGHQQEVLELVDELRRSHNLTVLATMHDLTIAGEYAEQLVLLDHGHVVATGPPTDVLTAEHLSRHYHARVRVIAGASGPLVIPVRPAAADSASG